MRVAVNFVFKSRLKDLPFIIFLSFLVTFVVCRAYVYATRHDLLNINEYIYVRGVHIHHFSWGILLLAVVGLIAITHPQEWMVRKLAIGYGIGLGVTFDEFAMWLKLEDDYYAKLSYDALVVISLILLNLVYFPMFWKKVGRKTYSMIRRPKAVPA